MAKKKITDSSFDVLYDKLSPVEKQALGVLSIIYIPVATNVFLRCLRQLGVRDANKKFLTAKSIIEYLDKWQKQQLIHLDGSKLALELEYTEFFSHRVIRINGIEPVAQVVLNEFPFKKSTNTSRQHLRIHFYNNDSTSFNKIWRQINPYQFLDYPFVGIASQPFLPQFLDERKANLRGRMVFLALQALFFRGEFHEPLFLYAKNLCENIQSHSRLELEYIINETYLYRGQLSQVEEFLKTQNAIEMNGLKSMINFLQGNYQQCIHFYEIILSANQKRLNSELSKNFQTTGIFYVLSLLNSNQPDHLQQAEQYVNEIRDKMHHTYPLKNAYHALFLIIKIQNGETKAKTNLEEVEQISEIQYPLQEFIYLLAVKWFTPDYLNHFTDHLKRLFKHYQTNGYQWLAAEVAETLLQAGATTAKKFKISRDDFFQTIFQKPLANFIQPLQDWQRKLNALNALTESPATPSTDPQQAKPGDLRMTWWLAYNEEGLEFQITPKEQKFSQKGWTRGRQVSLQKLYDFPETYPYLTQQDLNICSCIREEQEHSHRYFTKTFYYWDDKVELLLIGHPLLFREENGMPIEVEKGEVEISIIKKDKSTLSLLLNQTLNIHQEIQIWETKPNVFQVYHLDDNQLQLLEIVKNGLDFPIEARESILETIQSLAAMVTIHSEIGGNGAEDAEEIDSDALIHVLLAPINEGLKISLQVRPFGNFGPYYAPGSGGSVVMTRLENRQYVARRKIEEEEKNRTFILKSCPTLQAFLAEMDNEWQIDERESCLQILLELEQIKEHISIEWPEGEQIRLKSSLDFNNFHMAIHRSQDWFEVTGEIHVDDNLLIDMQNLLELMEASPGRFVKMQDGEFLALTENFYKYLQDLDKYTEKHQKSRRFHPVASMVMDEMADKAGNLQIDKDWKKQVKKLKKLDRFLANLPDTFQGELRDYQLDGFYWMERLYHWGVGACLADDMGLGKTIQTLAVMLNHAKKGPMLVIAPTSVCMNWQKEAWKFAPTLNVIRFGEGDREKTLQDLKPFDLLICTYGLLQQEKTAAMLTSVEFEMVVLDEAQAIKNFSSKRAQAAIHLQANFKLITTGTPIENHLGELWSLFRFINPGLLGSLQRFNAKYAVPIERDGDGETRKRLKKLVQPFMLRRIKTQVLEELPPKTEIIIEVELSQKEQAFYEALRLKTVNRLSQEDKKPGQKHIEILAELMKLRRACCNVQLVSPNLKIASAKLEAFSEILSELLENKHKALVFSQFVDHLQIVKKHLETNKISYQYLDGSTPAKQREKRVDAFQAGEGDVFLISLKAGGSGLNLTAADYVIHLDPWWNPAVEDQASDRAHRIGQSRPVTIYRLVAQNTIEEKIVNLHSHKRDLADSLLEGSDVSGKISAEELLRLIKD